MNTMPTTFLEEFREVIGDVMPDFSVTIAETPQDAHDLYRKLVVNLMQNNDRSINERIDDLATMLMWMVLVGREHQARGFGSPIPRNDMEGRDLISDDTIARFLREG